MDLSPEQSAGLDIHLVPLTLTLDGKTYRSGVDIQPSEFYKLLEGTESFPVTSQPAPGDFAEVYRRLAATDPEILSVHISSGLSGTLNSAQQGAKMVPEARVTFYDTKTLSGAEGWHVEAAARAAQAGWAMPRILEMLQKITAATDTVFTLAELKYLIHGGRISHMKGLLASVLGIKPDHRRGERTGQVRADGAGPHAQPGHGQDRGHHRPSLRARHGAARAGHARRQPAGRGLLREKMGAAILVHLAAGVLHRAGAGRPHRANPGGRGLRAAGRTARDAVDPTSLRSLDRCTPMAYTLDRA